MLFLCELRIFSAAKILLKIHPAQLRLAQCGLASRAYGLTGMWAATAKRAAISLFRWLHSQFSLGKGLCFGRGRTGLPHFFLQGCTKGLARFSPLAAKGFVFFVLKVPSLLVGGGNGHRPHREG
ncbi:MAG: hypothetical protein ACK5L3_13090, partial [Oscillospiraceae bacterium]